MFVTVCKQNKLHQSDARAICIFGEGAIFGGFCEILYGSPLYKSVSRQGGQAKLAQKLVVLFGSCGNVLRYARQIIVHFL